MATFDFCSVNEWFKLRELSHCLLSELLFHTCGGRSRPPAELSNARNPYLVPKSTCEHVLVANNASWQISLFQHFWLKSFLGTDRHCISFQWIHGCIEIDQSSNVWSPRSCRDEHLRILWNIDDSTVCLNLCHSLALLAVFISDCLHSFNSSIVQEGNI